MTILNPCEWWAYANSGCNVYLFSSENADSLQLGEPFSGNFKCIISGESTAGINPLVLAGIQSPFVSSTDSVESPEWNQFEIAAVGLTYVVDETFNGVVTYYKDDTQFKLDMGAQEPFLGRAFTDLDPVLQSHYVLNNPISIPSTGANISISFVADNVSPYMYFMDGDVSDRFFVLTDGSANIQWDFNRVTKCLLDGVEISSSTVPIPSDGKMHTLVFEAISGSIGFIGGKYENKDYFDGIITDFTYEDTSNPSNNQNYKLNLHTGNIEYAEENVFGVELVTNGDFSNGLTGYDYTAGKVTVVDGEAVMTCDGANYINIVQRNVMLPSTTYLIEFDCDNQSGALMEVQRNSSGVDADTSQFSVYTGEKKRVSAIVTTGVNSAGGLMFYCNPSATVGGKCYLDNLSVVQVSAALTYVNIPDPLRTDFVLDGNVWVGEDLVVNGDFTTDNGWTKGVGWAIGSGTANCDTTTNTNINQSINVNSGYSLRTSIDVLNYVSGNVQFSIDGGVGSKISANGTYEEEITTTGTNSTLYIPADYSSGFVGSVDNVSVKRLIEVAATPTDRKFAFMDSAKHAHYTLAAPVAMQDGDSVSFNMIAPLTIPATFNLVDGTHGENRCLLYVEPSGQMYRTIGSVTLVDGVYSNNLPLDGKMHRITLVAGGACDLLIFGAKYNSASPYGGVMSDIEIKIASDSSLNQTYPLDTAYGYAEQAKEGTGTINYINIEDSDRDMFVETPTGWTNIAPLPHVAPDTIEVFS